MQIQGTEIRSEINVTPLVDVVLVLLVIFMVVTPMLGSRHVELPFTGKPDHAGPSRSKTIVRKFKGEILFDQRPVSQAELARLLEELYQRDPLTLIFLEADRRSDYGSVFSVMEIVSVSGFHNILLSGQPKR